MNEPIWFFCSDLNSFYHKCPICRQSLDKCHRFCCCCCCCFSAVNRLQLRCYFTVCRFGNGNIVKNVNILHAALSNSHGSSTSQSIMCIWQRKNFTSIKSYCIWLVVGFAIRNACTHINKHTKSISYHIDKIRNLSIYPTASTVAPPPLFFVSLVLKLICHNNNRSVWSVHQLQSH